MILQCNQGEALYIINSVGIAYHQHKVLYIIKPQENTRWRVMPCRRKATDYMQRAWRVDYIPILRIG